MHEAGLPRGQLAWATAGRREKKRLSSSQMATMEAPTSGKQIPSTTSTAMAPPMGFTWAGFRPRVFTTASDWAAKASFSSYQPMSSDCSPA